MQRQNSRRLDVVTEKFWFGSGVLIKKLSFDVTYEEIGVVGSHFCSDRQIDRRLENGLDRYPLLDLR